MTDDTWGLVREELQKSVGKDNYVTWIKPMRFVGFEDGVAEFDLKTSFHRDWVQRNYEEEIKHQIGKQGVVVDRVKFSVGAPPPTPNDAAMAVPRDKPRPAPALVQARDANSPSAALDPRFTFERFVVGKPNALAHAAARSVAENRDVTFNPLFLYGGVGLGKTHLMHAIAWELRRTAPHKKVVYLSAEQFMYRFIQALREKDMLNFKNLFRSVDVLMVDDVQFIAGKDSTQEEFFHTFNALIDQKKQIVLSAEFAPGDIDGLDERIISRLQWGLVVDLHPTDYELRLGILQQLYEAKRDAVPQFRLDENVLEFLAQRINTNVRTLEGAMIRLAAHGELLGRAITLDMARDQLTDLLRQVDRKITLDEIMRKTCDYYNLRIAEMISPKRSRNIARPRQMAMYLSKSLTSKSYPEIGRHFGKRDHTTVMHAVRKIEALQMEDAQIAEDAKILRRMIEG